MRVAAGTAVHDAGVMPARSERLPRPARPGADPTHVVDRPAARHQPQGRRRRRVAASPPAYVQRRDPLRGNGERKRIGSLHEARGGPRRARALPSLLRQRAAKPSTGQAAETRTIRGQCQRYQVYDSPPSHTSGDHASARPAVSPPLVLPTESSATVPSTGRSAGGTGVEREVVVANDGDEDRDPQPIHPTAPMYCALIEARPDAITATSPPSSKLPSTGR